jgi:hypothetical protein
MFSDLLKFSSLYLREPAITSQDVSLIHELGTKKNHVICLLLSKELPSSVSGKGIQPHRWFIQK